jgi:uncharacterized OB-fold protein
MTTTTTEDVAQRPVPEPDEGSQRFFDGAKEGDLMLRQCGDCGAWLHPQAAICSECLGEKIDWAQASGQGTVFSFGVMHRVYHPGFIHDVPYNLAIIELDEGPRINTNLVNVDSSEIKVGMHVRAVFEEQPGGVVLPKFEPA